MIGKHIELREDERGLFFKAKIAPTEKGDEVLALLAGGFVSGVSIGFEITDSDQDKDNPSVRRLKSLKLWENSIVTFPSNDLARALHVRMSEGMGTEQRGSLLDLLTKTIADLQTILGSLTGVRDAVRVLEFKTPDPDKSLHDPEEDEEGDLAIKTMGVKLAAWDLKSAVRSIRDSLQ